MIMVTTGSVFTNPENREHVLDIIYDALDVLDAVGEKGEVMTLKELEKKKAEIGAEIRRIKQREAIVGTVKYNIRSYPTSRQAEHTIYINRQANPMTTRYDSVIAVYSKDECIACLDTLINDLSVMREWLGGADVGFGRYVDE